MGLGMDWEKGQGHYPYQAGIDAYGNGGFRFAGMSHRGSLLCLPEGMFAWDAAAPEDIDAAALSRALASSIEVLLIGTGDEIAPIPRALRQAFRDRGTTVEAIATGSAVRTYNVLLHENRSIGAALLAVVRARV